MQDIHQLRVTINQMLVSQRLAVLATQGDGRPYGSLVAFAATEDMKNLLLEFEHNSGEPFVGEGFSFSLVADGPVLAKDTAEIAAAEKNRP